jgi:hypothetical protein
MEFSLEAANDYCLQHSSSTPELLEEIHAFTNQHHTEPHMLSGPLQGKFLSMISQMIQPRRILEIGTFTGYSALCLAEGLAPDGVLHTIEKREEDASIAKEFFNRSNFSHQIIQHTGDAHEIIDTINEEWDLVFIDADKTGYTEYFLLLLDRVKSGTYLLFDNVLFHGEVLNEQAKGKSAKAIISFNEFIKTNNQIDLVMVPIRDGISIVRKK